LAKKGCYGYYSLDFVCVEEPDKYDIYAVEVNLRPGGTTHPFMTLQYLISAKYNEEAAAFIDRYVCTLPPSLSLSKPYVF